VVECHELFGDPSYGREAADLAMRTMRRARKTAIMLAFDTQSSRADAIPPKIVELVKLMMTAAAVVGVGHDGHPFERLISLQVGGEGTGLSLDPPTNVGVDRVVTGQMPSDLG
jgi:hypothetical protein